RKGSRPHDALVEVCRVVEAERRISRFELCRRLEEADDLTIVIGVSWHPVPGFWKERRRVRFDDLMDPLGNGAIRFRHLGDLFEQIAFSVLSFLVRTRFCLQFFGALLHRSLFRSGESLGGVSLCAHSCLLVSTV